MIEYGHLVRCDVTGMRSYAGAEMDGEGMALKIRLERDDFPIVPMPKIIHTMSDLKPKITRRLA